ncbi:hypothetical protein IWX49DRAFT_631575 [Phyllosticta citricarpa]|uniref:Uncharacterized protein n=2 Tax=Phyllosticta TaxID=121621 RepID=A0ABR1MHS2_9PEZI
MPNDPTKKTQVLIELRSEHSHSHSRHRFVRRHNTAEHHTKKAHDRQPQPKSTRLLSWSLSIETRSPKPTRKRRSAKTRGVGGSTSNSTAQTEARSETCCCCRGDAGAVRVIKDENDNDDDALGRRGAWGCLDDDHDGGDGDVASAAWDGCGGWEREKMRRTRHHHRHRHHQHRGHHQHQNIYYRPSIAIIDNSQVQVQVQHNNNNYYYDDYDNDHDHDHAGHCPSHLDGTAHLVDRKAKSLGADSASLLPDLETLSLSSESERSEEMAQAQALPPAYSEIFPRSRGTVGAGFGFRSDGGGALGGGEGYAEAGFDTYL